MKKKITINVKIVPMFKLDQRYKVNVVYEEGGAIFTDDNYEKGFPLYQAQALLLTMHDAIKPKFRG